jgi:hypothetical protein
MYIHTHIYTHIHITKIIYLKRQAPGLEQPGKQGIVCGERLAREDKGAAGAVLNCVVWGGWLKGRVLFLFYFHFHFHFILFSLGRVWWCMCKNKNTIPQTPNTNQRTETPTAGATPLHPPATPTPRKPDPLTTPHSPVPALGKPPRQSPETQQPSQRRCPMWGPGAAVCARGG